jgi:protease I
MCWHLLNDRRVTLAAAIRSRIHLYVIGIITYDTGYVELGYTDFHRTHTLCTGGPPTMRIACLLDSGFEDSEFRKPYEALRAAGHEVVVVGFDAGSLLRGKQGEERVRADRGIADVSSSDFDALLLPGGGSPDRLRGDARMVAFTKGFFLRNRPVLAICHGPRLLIAAGVVEGRTMTAWKIVQEDLRSAGASVVDQEVVVDGNLVTSRQPDDLDAFSRASLTVLEQAAAASV